MNNYAVVKKKARNKDSLTPLVLFLAVIILFLPLFTTSCSSYRLRQKLSPRDAEFLSQVRYIITRQEEKIYLEMSEDDRQSFKDEFWRRRDYDPDTPENEFKMEYFNRLERANELFRGEGTPGWLTDRGRIFILFGPPTERIENPRGYDSYGRCEELWYYGRFPVVFLDRYCMGAFRLVTYDLTAISYLNLRYMTDLSRAQDQAQQTLTGEKGYFDFDWEVKATLVELDRTEGVVYIRVPYAKLWYREAEAGLLDTTLDVRLELKERDNQVLWKHEEAFRVEIEEERLQKAKREEFEITIPFILEDGLERMRKKKSRMYILIKNRTGGEQLQKVSDI